MAELHLNILILLRDLFQFEFIKVIFVLQIKVVGANIGCGLVLCINEGVKFIEKICIKV